MDRRTFNVRPDRRAKGVESMAVKTELDHIFEDKTLVIFGVSTTNAGKFGNRIFHFFQERGREIYAVNPKFSEDAGENRFRSLQELPVKPDIAVLVTPPEQSVKITESLAGSSVKKIWYQQGSSDRRVTETAETLGFEYIAEECVFMHQHPVSGIHGVHRWIKKLF